MSYSCISLDSSLYENSDGLLDVHFPIDSGFEIDAGLALVDSERAPIWVSFTPTWSGFAIGNGVQRARYMKVNKLIFFSVVINLGSTSSLVGRITFNPPVPAAEAFTGVTTDIYTPCGQIWTQKASTNYQGILFHHNGVFVPSVGNATGGDTALNSVNGTTNVPWIWAANDQLSMTGWYKAA